MDPRILATTFVFASVAFGTLAVILAGELIGLWRQRKDLSDRLEEVVFERTATGEGSRLLKKVRGRRLGVAGVEKALPWFADIEILIEQAGGGTLQAFLLAAVGLTFAFGISALVFSGSLLVGVAAAVFGAVIPYVYLRLKRKRRYRAFEAGLPESIDLMTRAIRAGHPFSAGVGMVAEEAPAPVSTEFQRLFDEMRFGLPFEEAVLGMTDRVDLVDTRMFATAVLVQREVGGNLAEILDNLAGTIRSRFSIRRQLRVITAQGRLSGYILSVLPIAVGFGLFLISPDFMAPLLESPVGHALIMASVVAQVLGYLWIRQIVNIEI
ncbi:MAG: type II secretion system F family protein [Gemmatimonadota bacterium]|nr:type II secretion system F family protein [Gemmatimonadota bacterium]